MPCTGDFEIIRHNCSMNYTRWKVMCNTQVLNICTCSMQVTAQNSNSIIYCMKASDPYAHRHTHNYKQRECWHIMIRHTWDAPVILFLHPHNWGQPSCIYMLIILVPVSSLEVRYISNWLIALFTDLWGSFYCELFFYYLVYNIT